MKHRVLNTIMSGNVFSIEETPHQLTDKEFSLCGSFPLDYDYMENKAQYIIGMSVPPVMTAQIAKQIFEQWLSKL